MPQKKLKAFRLEDDVVQAMKHIKDTERIPETAQVNFAMRAWLEKRGSLPKGGRKKR